MSREREELKLLLDALRAAGWVVTDRHREELLRTTPPREVYLGYGDASGRLHIEPKTADDLLAELELLNPLDPGLSESGDGLGGQLVTAYGRIVGDTAAADALEPVDDPVIVVRARVPTSATGEDLRVLADDITAVATETTKLHEAVVRTISTWSADE